MKKIILGILALGISITSVFPFKENNPKNRTGDVQYQIIKKWELPAELSEISGIAWIGDNRIACVQDEDGIIFVYNLETSKMEDKQIKFGESGDYEGVTVVGDDIYVLRSDGVIFEVSGFLDANPQVKKHVTQTNKLKGINLEGICADPDNNRLLLAVKERKDLPLHKEIFAFNLNKKDSEKDPLYKIDLSDAIFEEVKDKAKNKFAPGEINIHPQTGEHYILDGTKPKLLITNKDGSAKELIMLNLKDFGNPEGLTFSPDGKLYISNEAEDGPANILQVTLNRN